MSAVLLVSVASTVLMREALSAATARVVIPWKQTCEPAKSQVRRDDVLITTYFCNMYLGIMCSAYKITPQFFNFLLHMMSFTHCGFCFTKATLA